MISEADRRQAVDRARAANARPKADAVPPRRSGHGWFFTGSLCVFSLAMGFAGGLGTKDLLAVTNEYHERMRPKTATATGPILEEPAEQPKAPTWYPDNNKIEWSTSLRPGDSPVPLDVSNESKTRHRRVLFYAMEQGALRLSATLFVRAGQKALIHLPAAQYRIDIASTADTMPWEEALAVVPLPSYALTLPEDERTDIPTSKLVIEDEGKVRFTNLKAIVSEAKATRASDEPVEADDPSEAPDPAEITD